MIAPLPIVNSRLTDEVARDAADAARAFARSGRRTGPQIRAKLKQIEEEIVELNQAIRELELERAVLESELSDVPAREPQNPWPMVTDEYRTWQGAYNQVLE